MESERHVFNQNIFVDDDIEIVTKKVFFRGASLHPRDLYDLATVYLGPRRSELVNALINIPEQLQEFHDALQRVGPGFSFSYALSASIIVTISSAFRAMCLTPKSLCNCSSLKPHVTPMHSRPKLFAVSTSTSESPM